MAASESLAATSSSAGKETPNNDNIVNWRNLTPLGVRFYPSVEELIVHYLKPAKDKDFSIPAGTVTRANVYSHTPMELWDIGVQHYQDTMYFVTCLSAAQISVEKNRQTEDGNFWRMIGMRQTFTLSNGIVVVEKEYHFYLGSYRVDQFVMTEFVMTEYQDDDMAICCLRRTEDKNNIMAATGSSAAIGSSAGKETPDNDNVVDWRHLVPPGVRFYPSVEELIVHYLKPAKDKNFPLPPFTLVRANVYDHTPMELWNIGVEQYQDSMYFVTRLSATRKSVDKIRRTKDGNFWRIIGKKKQLESSGGTPVWESKYHFFWHHLGSDPRQEEDVVMTEYREEEDAMTICCLELRQRTQAPIPFLG